MASGEMARREMTYTEAALEALTAAMVRDPTIFVLGEGIGERGGNFNTTKGLYQRFGPRRLRDTPICERGFVGLCTGAATTRRLAAAAATVRLVLRGPYVNLAMEVSL